MIIEGQELLLNKQDDDFITRKEIIKLYRDNIYGMLYPRDNIEEVIAKYNQTFLSILNKHNIRLTEGAIIQKSEAINILEEITNVIKNQV